MFFAKSLLVVAALAASVLGHATVGQPLGVKGTPIRADAQRPSTAKPCGKAALTAIDSTTAVTMTGNTFNVAATNYNLAKDGSLQFTAQVDAAGTGKAFKAATITKNGTAAPKKIGEVDQLSVSMPAGTQCTGGAGKNLCLVSFKSASGFGNCIVVKQGGAAAASTKAAPAAKAAAKTTRSRHAREFVIPANKRDYTKRAISWIWAPTA